MRLPWLIFLVLVGGLLFGSGAFAADLVFEDDTIVEIGGHDYVILAGSEATTLDVGDTTVTVTAPSGSTFNFQSPDRHVLGNSAGIAQTCTASDNRLAITGSQSNLVITPDPATLCTIPEEEAPAPPVAQFSIPPPSDPEPTPTTSPSPEPSPTPDPTPEPTPSPTPEPDAEPDPAPSPAPVPSDPPPPRDPVDPADEEPTPDPIPSPTPEPTPPAQSVEQGLWGISLPPMPETLQEVVRAVPGPVGRTVVTTIVVAGVGAGAVQSVFVAASLASFSDLWLLLMRFLLTVPSFLGIRKRPRPWGTVYDSVTKRPLDPAYVIAEKDGKEVASAITDLDGRYGFLLGPGAYTLKAHKTHYAFPSSSMKGRQSDELYSNLYYGTLVSVDQGEIVARDIPMDPVGFDWNEFAKNKKAMFAFYSQKAKTRARVFNALFALGFLTTLILTVFFFSIASFLALAAYTIVFLFRAFRRFTRHSVSVKIAGTKEPLSFAIVRLFASSTGRLVKSAAADEQGQVYFLVSPGSYYLTIEAKLQDGSYNQVHHSGTMNLKKGVLDRDIVVPGTTL